MEKTDTVLVGPWGGVGGNPWSYTVKGKISNIFITHDGNGVNSIRFTSKDKKGVTYKSGLFGVANGTEKEIVVDSKVEELISVEGSVGTYNSVRRVTSLGFTTTKIKHEPVGTGKNESEFSCLLSRDPFTGFHGCSDTVLNSIGISVGVKTRELAGPWPASAGGTPWDYISKGPICRIYITYDDDIVHSLQFASRDADRFLHKSSIIGTADGCKTREVKIDTKIQKIVGILGAYGPYAGTTSVKSVTFITSSLRSIGPFGTQKDEDTPFSHSVQDEDLLFGFHGHTGSFIDSIGVYYTQPGKSCAMVGPFSGTGGSSWSYEPQGLISRIIMTTSGAVHTLQFESIDANGIKHISEVWGADLGIKKHTIDIEKDDKITNISGIIAEHGGWFISRLYISTEKREVYGPFGEGEAGTKFSFPVKDGYISGFHGKSSHALTAIGVYIKPT